ncbi:hypothetical protein D3C76_1455520 [compost metagenome]
MGLLIAPAPKQVINEIGPYEQRQPLHQGAGEKMGFFGFGDDVAAPAHGMPSFAAWGMTMLPVSRRLGIDE